VYASTDNIIADVRSGDHIMGDEFTVSGNPEISISLTGTAPFAKVAVIKDGREVFTTQSNSITTNLKWTDSAAVAGKTSWYYVRGEQNDGQVVWVSPMWITVQ
jgi:hypothetical protein